MDFLFLLYMYCTTKYLCNIFLDQSENHGIFKEIKKFIYISIAQSFSHYQSSK